MSRGVRSVRSPYIVTTSKSSSIWRKYEEFDVDYEVVQTLGEGGFGRVQLVRNRKRNVQFAMKELDEFGPDVFREVELMVTLTKTNPHVVSYFDRFVRTDSDGKKRYCIMMDYVRGVNMLDYVKRKKPINNLVVYWFLRSALEALAHLHEMRVAHRDIKPENYIVAPYRVDDEPSTIIQRLVTIDFGLGSFLKRGGTLYKNDAEEVVGTPNYSSPQVIDADNAGEIWLDAKSDDVWALGASFYYLCTGEHIAEHHSGKSWSRSWKEVMKFQCPKVVWAQHPLLNRIITLALTKDHEKRPSAAELLEMLTDGWDAETTGAMDAVYSVPVSTTPTKSDERKSNSADKDDAKKKKKSQQQQQQQQPVEGKRKRERPVRAASAAAMEAMTKKGKRTQVNSSDEEENRVNNRVAALKPKRAASAASALTKTATKATRYPLRNRKVKL